MRLSKQRPWHSAEENWLAAERALRQKPWRPWVIRFSGEKERSGWDWADLILRISVPVLILVLGAGLNKCTSDREERLARQERESAVVSGFIGEMQKLIIANRIVPGKQVSGESLVLPRELTTSALAQLGAEDAHQWRSQVLRFVRGLKLIQKGGGNLLLSADLSHLNLREADLREAGLRKAELMEANLSLARLDEADLREATLIDANLSMAQLRGADLREAEISGANLSKAYLDGANLGQANLAMANLIKAELNRASLKGANLSGADLSGANLSNISWTDFTRWPSPASFKGAKNIPPELKKQLGIP